ncbi:MAG: transglycosylase SLT domain-containing protein, partial [Longimicrobiales bacterium]
MLRTLEYFRRLGASILRGGGGWSRARPVIRRVAAVATIAIALIVPFAALRPAGPTRLAGVESLASRAAHVQTLLRAAERVYHDEVAPIENVLLRYRDDPALARDIAVALTREARRVGVEARLLLAVLLVENPDLNPGAVSPVGARGLMQVMPLHRGEWKECEPRLDDIDANICHGASIFAHYLERSDGDVERALLRYNGCVRGTNTPNCHSYPMWVYA